MAAFIKREKAPDAHKNIICHCEFMGFGSANISFFNNGVQHCP